MPDMMTPPVPAPPAPPGATGQSVMPPQNKGMDGQARVIGAAVATALTKMLAMLDPMSKQAQTARKALDILTKEFGPASADLSRAQAKTFASNAPPVQPGPQMAQQRLGQMGLQPPQGA